MNKELNNEELAIVYQQTKDEIVFEELYSRFNKMMKWFINKHVLYGYLEKDELISLCNVGLYKAIMAYSSDKPVKLSTMIYRYIQTAIHHKYDYCKRNGRDYIKNNSVSINKTIESSFGKIPLVEIIYYNNCEDEYFTEKFELSNAYEYALSKSCKEVRDYLIPTIIGDYTLNIASEILGIKYQALQYHIKKFKKLVKEYVNNNSIVA